MATLVRRGHYDAAIELYESVPPQTPGALNNFGVALLQNARTDEAIDMLKRAIGLRQSRSVLSRRC